MTLTIVQNEKVGNHSWSVIHATCDLSAPDDKLLTDLVKMVREAYGESRVIRLAESLLVEVDPAVRANFSLEAIALAIRRGMPNPIVESKKPMQLRNYRSEVCEMLAKCALQLAHPIEFPVAPQSGKTNANMPILGFDHWGILKREGGQFSLVLVQVKGTEEQSCPPSICDDLVKECKKIPTQVDEICRALTIICLALQGSPLLTPVICMLDQLGRNLLPDLVVAPSLIRGGNLHSSIEDLSTLRTSTSKFVPATAHGISLSTGVDLAELGALVMDRARAGK